MRKTNIVLTASVLFLLSCASQSGSTVRDSTSDDMSAAAQTTRTPAEENEPAAEPTNGPATAVASEPDESEAGQVARAIQTAAGGEELENVAQLEFRFVVEADGERALEVWHRWDRAQMRDRVQWTDEEGRLIDALVDLRTREGWAFIDGEPASGEEEDELLQAAFARWVNDSYWLLMPLKLRDPGVNVEMAPDVETPEAIDSSREWDVLKITFDDVGLTSGDRYWLYVDPETRRVEYWVMQLEGRTEEQRTAASWEDYREVGPLSLAHERGLAEKDRRILFEDVEALAHVQPQDFEKPTQ